MSYQGEPSDIELISSRDPFEISAALHLGLLLFAFSRLELSIERYLDRVAPAAPSPGQDRMPLKRLVDFVDGLSDATLREGFRQWIVRAHRLEGLRAAIAAARWIPDPRRNCLLFDAGPATASPQYVVSELANSLAALKELQTGLQLLCATAAEPVA